LIDPLALFVAYVLDTLKHRHSARSAGQHYCTN